MLVWVPVISFTFTTTSLISTRSGWYESDATPLDIGATVRFKWDWLGLSRAPILMWHCWLCLFSHVVCCLLLLTTVAYWARRVTQTHMLIAELRVSNLAPRSSMQLRESLLTDRPFRTSPPSTEDCSTHVVFLVQPCSSNSPPSPRQRQKSSSCYSSNSSAARLMAMSLGLGGWGYLRWRLCTGKALFYTSFLAQANWWPHDPLYI